MKTERRWFFVRATAKAFWYHPWRVLLMSLFMGLALGLLWLSWDIQMAMDTYIQALWRSTGIPFTVRALGASGGENVLEPLGPVRKAEWERVVSRVPPVGPWVPWVQREYNHDGLAIVWVITDVHTLPNIRPWMELHPPGRVLYRSGWLTPEDAWVAWCRAYPQVCDNREPGRWITGHERLHILVDLTAYEAVRPLRMYDWIEGRWTGDRAAFETWRRRLQNEFGLTVEADLPALSRFRLMGDTVRRFLRWTGVGLLFMSFFTYLLIILLDTHHRRYEWAIWSGVGADPTHFIVHFVLMAVFWSLSIFLLSNGMYWVGKGAIRLWLPELDVRPLWWEGPVIAVVGGLICMLAMLPAYFQVRRLEPAALLRGE